MIESQHGEYVNERRAAEICGLRVSTLRKWRQRGRGPRFRKLGERAVRYSLLDLDSWLTAQPTGGTDTAGA